MNATSKKMVLGTLLAAALTAAASMALLFRDYQSQVQSHRNGMVARGQTVLDALAAGIRAQGRMGRYRPERLSVIFEELASAPDIVLVDLHTLSGVSIAKGGESDSLPVVEANRPRWLPGRLVIACEPMLLGHGPGGGRGPGGGFVNTQGWESMPDGPYVLTAVLDTHEMDSEIQNARWRFLWSTAVTAGAMGLAVLFALALARQRSLQSALLLAHERTAQQEHLTYLGAGLAHETKNPLGIVRGLAQLISESPENPSGCAENKKYAQCIVDEIDRTVGQIDSFLSLARPRHAQMGTVALDALFASLEPLVMPEAQQRKVRIQFDSGGFWVRADEAMLRRALMNLILNAFRASASGGDIQVSARAAGKQISLSVSDTGCGIAPEELPRVIEPYYAKFNGGSGLGLALVNQIAQAHGWALRILSEEGRGTRVILEGIEGVRNRAE